MGSAESQSTLIVRLCDFSSEGEAVDGARAKCEEVLSRVVAELFVDDTAFWDVKGDAVAGIEPSLVDNPARRLLDAHQDNLLKK